MWCRFDYGCNMGYRSLVKSLKVKLQTVQHRIIRFILKQEPKYHLFYSDCKKELIISMIKSIVDYITLNLMCNIAYHIDPVCMSDYVARILCALLAVHCIFTFATNCILVFVYYICYNYERIH